MTARLTRRTLLAGLAAGLSGCAREDPFAALSDGEAGRIVRVYSGHSLSLDGGTGVRLAEIEAPADAYEDRPAQVHAAEATAICVRLALGRDATLRYGGLSRDRYDRAIAHVFIADRAGALWLNGALVEAGAARVRTWPDNHAMAAALLQRERAARRAGRGLWALPDYRVLTPGEAVRARGFHLVEGIVAAVETPEEVRLFFEGGFVADARQDAVAWWPGGAAALAALSGQRVRVRGWIGPNGRLRLTHAAQVETDLAAPA